MSHDVFICHASEDKDEFVRPLAEALSAHNVRVWYDEFSITLGDSLREKIDQGLATSEFGIVVISHSFFKKPWTQWELNGLVARKLSTGRQLILPVWHGVDHNDIVRIAPSIADIAAVSSKDGLENVVQKLLSTIKPQKNPFSVAKDILSAKGLDTPPLTDDWWLDILEIKESNFDPWGPFSRWTFPLPFENEKNAEERGQNVAWTALQLDWASDDEGLSLSQLSHPEKIYAFLQKWPGLIERAYDCPGSIALYAPQLTIRGYDHNLSEAFDQLLDPNRKDAYQSPGYGGTPETINGKEPLCGELVSWRHPTFGNYMEHELAYSFVHANVRSYSRRSFNAFECLIWLLSHEASWMPNLLREKLIEGMRQRHMWFREIEFDGQQNDFINALFEKRRSAFRLTRNIQTSIGELCSIALQKLGSSCSSDDIVEEFIAREFIDGFYDEQDRVDTLRKAKK